MFMQIFHSLHRKKCRALSPFHFLNILYFSFPHRWSYYYYFMIEMRCAIYAIWNHCWKTQFNWFFGFALCFPMFTHLHSAFPFEIDQLKWKVCVCVCKAINCIGSKWWWSVLTLRTIQKREIKRKSHVLNMLAYIRFVPTPPHQLNWLKRKLYHVIMSFSFQFW